MTETASLVIKVDSSGAKRATADLDALARQGAKTEGAVAKLGSGFGALGKAFAALGGGVLIGKFLGAIISNTIEADKVQAQLAARIKSTGGAAGLALGDLNSMAKGLQNVTTYGDEAIGSAQALLLTFTSIHKDAFPKALEATLNLATAMGTDLNSAAVLVGKALNDPIQGVTALRRVGVQLTEQQQDLVKKLVETGDAAGAQKIILGELSVEMGGAARAARDTLGGALEAAKEAFGDLLEGDSGGDGVRGTKVALEDLIQTMKSPDTQAAFAQLVQGVFSVANAAVQAINKLIEFNNQLEVSYGLKGNGTPGQRNASLIDTVKAIPAGVKALFHGDFKEATRQADIAYAGAFGGTTRDENYRYSNPGDADSQFVPDYLHPTKAPAYSFAPFNFATSGPTRRTGGGAAANDSGATGGGSGGGGGRARQALPQIDRQGAIEDLQKEIADAKAANDAYKDLAATLAGPLAEAQREHEKRVADIDDLAARDAEASAHKQELLDGEAKRYAEVTKQIQAQLDPVGQALDNQALELDLIGKSNAEREVMNALLAKGTDLRSADAQAALAQARANQAEAESRQQAIDLMDDFRRGAANALTDLVTGAESAKDALKDFFDELAAQVTQAIANQWIKQLFGPQGSDGSGTSGGGLLKNLFGAILGSGGGYATGGYTGPGAMNQPAGVVHKGEVVWSQADIAAAGGVGAVEAMRKGGRSGSNVTNITVNVPRSFEYRAASAVAQATAQVQARATARNR